MALRIKKRLKSLTSNALKPNRRITTREIVSRPVSKLFYFSHLQIQKPNQFKWVKSKRLNKKTMMILTCEASSKICKTFSVTSEESFHFQSIKIVALFLVLLTRSMEESGRIQAALQMTWSLIIIARSKWVSYRAEMLPNLILGLFC